MRAGDAVLFLAGWVLELIHAPARIREFEFVDPVSGETVYLSTGKLYSKLFVNGQTFYFDRVTGRFDGTVESPQERIVRRVELFD